MIYYLYGDQLAEHGHLANGMFCDRAAQFRDRLNWDVTVTASGEERDEYDDLNPLYVIWRQPNGRHGGSMRFLPTVGRTMLSEHFSGQIEQTIQSPLIWECTRFCLAPGAVPKSKIAKLLMLAAAELGLAFHLAHSVAVFDRQTAGVYRGLGWQPTMLDRASTGDPRIRVGLWDYSTEVRDALARRAGVSTAVSTHWINRAFGSIAPV